MLWLVALSLLVAIVAAAVTVSRVARIGLVLDVQPALLAQWLKRRPAAVPAVARACAEVGCAPLALELAEALAAPDATRAASCNEALHDLAAELEAAEDVSAAALRLVILSSLLAVASVVIGRVDVGERLLDVVGVGGAATGIVLWARRVARASSARRRADVDQWVAACVGRDQVAAPATRESAEGRRRGGARR